MHNQIETPTAQITCLRPRSQSGHMKIFRTDLAPRKRARVNQHLFALLQQTPEN